ncbi:MAG: hypothetical protein GXY83_29625 [Rhodopirellula sp.]|nr:hypothetical protein [Rhodopirellula sp.]
MEIGWQDIAALVCVAAAAAYLVRGVLRRRGDKSAGCAGCTGCQGEPARRDLISIDPPRKQDGA